MFSTAQRTRFPRFGLGAPQPAPQPPSVLEAAEARYHELRRRRTELTNDLTGMRFELSRRDQATGDATPSPAMALLAKPWRRVASRRLRLQIEDAEAELRGLADDLADARDDLAVLNARAAEAKARDLAPQHRAAVARALEALFALDAALAEERRLRVESRNAATGAELLPNLGMLALGRLDDPNSTAARWVKQLRAAGYGDR